MMADGSGKGGKTVCLATIKSGVMIGNVKVAIKEMENFFKMESLGTIVEPRCGFCHCGKCLVPGSRYSHRDKSELKLLEEGLHYNSKRSCWVMSNPYLHPREL